MAFIYFPCDSGTTNFYLSWKFFSFRLFWCLHAHLLIFFPSFGLSVSPLLTWHIIILKIHSQVCAIPCTSLTLMFLHNSCTHFFYYFAQSYLPVWIDHLWQCIENVVFAVCFVVIVGGQVAFVCDVWNRFCFNQFPHQLCYDSNLIDIDAVHVINLILMEAPLYAGSTNFIFIFC